MNQETNPSLKATDELFREAMQSISTKKEKMDDTEDGPPGEFLLDGKTGKGVTIHGKPVILWYAKSVLNMNSGFLHKHLCTGPTFNLGDACAYCCPYCYVEAAAHGRFAEFLKQHDLNFQEVVIRRQNAVEILRRQLAKLSAKQRDFPHVVYSSTTVDVAGNVELAKETAAACTLILEMTNWEIRLLSKSNMLPYLVSLIPKKDNYHKRLILGVSTGIPCSGTMRWTWPFWPTGTS
ncbi:MAG: hypothetical protein LV479_04400 [Methylacidiphilales bacterium]|nr:hypothetical protein [Candidatus Methylacidiphilales bacterium]